MKLMKLALGSALLASSVAAQATTVVVIVDPMTFEQHTKIIDTPGPDRLVMCMAPPATSGCTELPVRRRR